MTMFLYTVLLIFGVLETTHAEPAKDFCTDGSGKIRVLRESWEEGIYKCDCVYPESQLYFWDGTNPSDAQPHCLANGCVNPAGGPLLKNGDFFENSNGDGCRCVRGNHPFLMDAYTLYHAQCFSGLGEDSAYYIDFDQN